MKHETPMVESSLSRVKKYINHADTVFEIGAFDGVDVSGIKTLFGDLCKIHAFEPDPEAFQGLKTYASDTVVCNQLALSNKIGDTKFVKCFDTSTQNQESRSLWYKTAQSLYHNSSFHKGDRPLIELEIPVKVDTIDNYCKNNNVTPQVICMDTQGSEWDILDGARATLPEIKVIMTEWSSRELYSGQKLLIDIEKLLAEFGFILIERIDLWGDFHGDAIFIKR